MNLSPLVFWNALQVKECPNPGQCVVHSSTSFVHDCCLICSCHRNCLCHSVSRVDCDSCHRRHMHRIHGNREFIIITRPPDFALNVSDIYNFFAYVLFQGCVERGGMDRCPAGLHHVRWSIIDQHLRNCCNRRSKQSVGYCFSIPTWSDFQVSWFSRLIFSIVLTRWL